MINDYESKLREFETDKKQTAKLMKVIEDLTEQKNHLNSRLQKANKQKFMVGKATIDMYDKGDDNL